MAAVTIRAFDASRRRLDDVVDVSVAVASSGAIMQVFRQRPGTETWLADGLRPGQVYHVQVLPDRYRPVGHLVRAPDGAAPANVHLFCPVKPDAVRAIRPPAYTTLSAGLRSVLDATHLDGLSGPDLYAALDPVRLAGLLNIATKLQQTVTRGQALWDFVERLTLIRGDRIFAEIRSEGYPHLLGSVDDFTPADDSLHHPPPGYVRAGSWKHRRYAAGVLQVTVFASESSPTRYLIDADIDDAGGLGHVFQVLRHWLTGGATHPYDIHQILRFTQGIDPGYELEF